METLHSVFRIIALSGFGASVVLRALSYASSWTWLFPFALLLNLGIPAVWCVAVIREKGLVQRADGAAYWRSLLDSCPRKLRILYYIVLAFILVDFILSLTASVLRSTGTLLIPVISGNEYVVLAFDCAIYFYVSAFIVFMKKANNEGRVSGQ